jgi:hypothetical protein
MVSVANHLDAMEIEKRAAQIRSQWSLAERRLRTGLPPDAPLRLREFVLGCRQPDWDAISPDRSRWIER